VPDTLSVRAGVTFDVSMVLSTRNFVAVKAISLLFTRSVVMRVPSLLPFTTLYCSTTGSCRPAFPSAFFSCDPPTFLLARRGVSVHRFMSLASGVSFFTRDVVERPWRPHLSFAFSGDVPPAFLLVCFSLL